jgi:MFS family permease
MLIKQSIIKILPFVFGLLIGISFSGLWWLSWLIIPYFIISVVLGLVGEAASKVEKQKTVKGKLKELSVTGMEQAIDYTALGINKGKNMFDNFFSYYVPLFSLGLLCYTLYLLFIHDWFNFGFYFIIFNLFILLNQIYRGVENRDKR